MSLTDGFVVTANGITTINGSPNAAIVAKPSQQRHQSANIFRQLSNSVVGKLGDDRRSNSNDRKQNNNDNTKNKNKSNSKTDYLFGSECIDMRVKGSLLPTSDDLKIATRKAKSKQNSLALFDITDITFILLLLAFVTSLCGTVVMWFTDVYSSQIKSQIINKLTLANNTVIHMSWRKPPLEPLLCIYIYNYTNSEAYLNSNETELTVEQVGPVCYRETIQRLNVTFFPNKTLSYNEQRFHVYDEKASVLSENVTVIVPNIPLLTAFAQTANFASPIQWIANSIIGARSQKMFIERSVKDFLFGYTDTMIENVKQIAALVQRPVPYDKFGIMIKRAGLSKDRLSIYTGEDDLEAMGQVTNINNMTEYNLWQTDSCNQVRGSDGLFFNRTAVQNHLDVALFHKDSCRPLPLQYDSKVDVGSGIIANRYALKPSIFDNDVDENQCFCGETKFCSFGNGIFDVSKCATGVPMLVSRPHFLGASLKNGTTVTKGISPPDNDKHGFYMDIWPALGLTVRMLMRVQMNVYVRNPHDSSTLGHTPDNFILPVTWVEMNSGEIPRKMHTLLYHLTYTVRWGELALMWGFIVLTLIFAFLVLRYSISKTSPKKEILIISKNRQNNNIISNTYMPA